jgi:hypothetical protein
MMGKWRHAVVPLVCEMFGMRLGAGVVFCGLMQCGWLRLYFVRFFSHTAHRPSFFVLVQRRFVEWEDFADHAMVHNPKGGTAVLPKMIIEKAKMDGFTHTKNKNGGQLKKK